MLGGPEWLHRKCSPGLRWNKGGDPGRSGYVDQHAQYPDEQAGKERCPETGDFEVPHECGNKQKHERIDYEQEESEGDHRERQCKNDEDWPDDGVNESEEQGRDPQRALTFELDAMKDFARQP